MIELKNINFSYGNFKALNNVSLSFKEGQLTSLIGSNAAGKSTLFSIISRLINPSSGEVYLDDKNLKDLKNVDISKKMALLKQSNNLSLRITVKELVSFGRFPHSAGRLNKDDEAMIKSAINYMDIKDIQDKYLDELSGGQRQRAYIAMIIAQDTKYILLDEPLNNLDIKYAVEMMTTLKKLVKDFSKTIIIVLHDINFAACYSDYIIAMKDGEVFKEGTPNEIIDKNVLDKIYEHEFNIADVQGKKVCIYN